MPKISVIIPLYNKAAHIRRALDSILAQTEQDFEVIVVDDGSRDGGGDIVRSIIDPRIKYRLQANSGVSAARNGGIQIAQSDFICFLDADDEYYPEFFATLLRLRQKYPQAGIYSTSYVTVYPGGQRVSPSLYAVPPTPWEGVLPNYFESSLGDPPVCTITVGVPKHILESVGGFPGGVSFGEDLDTWFRIALRYPVAYSGYPGAVCHCDAQNRACEIHKIADTYINNMQSSLESGGISASQKLFIQGMIDKQYIGAARACIGIGDGRNARGYLSNVASGFFEGQKRYWKLLSYLPHFMFGPLLWIKVRIINRIWNSLVCLI